MELEELIENTLRRKHLEEMMDRPKRVYTPIDGMDDMQIREFALFLYEENQKKSKQLDEMIARLDDIGKDLKEARKQMTVSLKPSRKPKRPCLNTRCFSRNTRSLRRNTMIFLTV